MSFRKRCKKQKERLRATFLRPNEYQVDDITVIWRTKKARCFKRIKNDSTEMCSLFSYQKGLDEW